MIEPLIHELFEKVKAHFNLPFNVRLVCAKAEELGAFARACYGVESKIEFVAEDWLLELGYDALEGAMAEQFGYLKCLYSEADILIKKFGKIEDIYNAILSYKAIAYAIKVGFGDQICSFYAKVAESGCKSEKLNIVFAALEDSGYEIQRAARGCNGIA